LTIFQFDLWPLLTRLGEMQLLLPAALIAIWRMRLESAARPLAMWWLLSLALATLITIATKVAFIGWGVGSARLNFTGISGHAMFASAIYPVLLGAFASHARRWVQRSAITVGFALAALVGLSRVMVGAHSVSETVAGLLLGGLVSLTLTLMHRLPRAVMGPRLALVVLAWLLVGILSAPVSPAHDLLTQWTLSLASKQVPFTRADLLKGVLQ
jgi:membrane-associated phospholipid phosphatase